MPPKLLYQAEGSGRSAAYPSRRPAVLLLAMVLPIALLLALLSLTPLGHWQMDELLMMRAYREHGLTALLRRIASWSPRPASETLLYAYSLVVHATGRQLTGSFLAGLWSLLIVASLAPAMLIRTGDPAGRRVAILVALTVLSLFVTGHPVAEVFYWPQAAAAYIPSIAFIAAPLICLVLVTGRSRRFDGLVAGCVSLAAMSSEVSTFFGVAFGASVILLHAIGRRSLQGSRAKSCSADLFALPLLTGSLVVYMLTNARFGSEAEIFDADIARHLSASLWWSLTTFPSDALSIDLGQATSQGLALGILSRTALLALTVLAFSRTAGARPPELKLLVVCFGFAALAAALFSLFAAYYQFGVNCCQRHQTLRSQLVVVAVVALGWLIAQSSLAARLAHRNVVWMALASAIAIASSAADMPAAIRHDVIDYRRIWEARQANWHDAMSPDPAMTLRLSHRGDIVGGIYAPHGDFRDDDATPRPLRAMMRYFGKSRIVTE